MKRISLQRLIGPTARLVCVIGLLFCFQQSVEADHICSTGTVTGFANDSGGFNDNSSPPTSFTIDLTGLGTDAAGNGFLELTTFGDFSNAAEYIDISIENVSFGTLWDNDTTNDSFVGTTADNDRGLEYGQNPSNQVNPPPGNASAIAQLTESQLDTFLADGVLSVTFDAFGAEVNNLVRDTDEFITAKVTINDPTAVPEPSTSLLVTALGLVSVVRRKRIG